MRVKYTGDNCADEVDGIKFADVDGCKVSEEISDEQHARFLTISGFEDYADADAKQKAAAEADAKAEEQRKAEEERRAAEADAAKKPQGGKKAKGGEGDGT